MALELEWDDVSPFLPPLNTTQRARVDAWLPVLSVILETRYGSLITQAREPLFHATAADALERRLTKPAGLIDSQSIGQASVKYNARAAITSWFLAEELDQLDEACGLGGGIRSFRTPAPDAVRFGNRNRLLDEVIEADGVFIEED